MNTAELNALLDRLLALPVETEWVEFKEAKFDFGAIPRNATIYIN